jgi:hypothetical protein
VAVAGQASGQHIHHEPPAASWSLGASVTWLVTRVAPAIGGENLTEGYLAQPVVTGRATVAGGHLTLRGTANLEGWTLDRGELDPGIYGEGYVDRRHPHTYLHELMAGIDGSVGRTAFSLYGGKGFAPFGTDDPMMRPIAKYPVNHHLAQILERAVLVVGLRKGPLLIEGGVFNGDEPEGPSSAPKASRFADSWSTRATILDASGAQLAASYAFVKSPEVRSGEGPDQRKWSAAARWSPPRPRGAWRYWLAEWARTDEYLGNQRFFRYWSGLGEAALGRGRFELAGRFERTTRPEEERLLNPYRTPRPLIDFNISGITRWDVATIAASTTRTFGAASIAPFVEVSRASPKEDLRPSAFVPEQFYGARRIWTVSGGVRLAVGSMAHRMGRYGVARE